jgi:agmatinase
MKIIAVPTDLGTVGRYNDVKNGPEAILEGDYETIMPEGNQEELIGKVYEAAKKDKNIFAVGGDHSISYPLIKAFLEKEPEGIVILYDAHADAEVATDITTHEDWVRLLIDRRIMNPENFVVVGVRKITPREREFFKKHNIKIHKRLPELPKRPVYITIDIDVLDPKECDDFFFKEENGMKFEELIEDLKKIDIHSGDLVELCPNLGSGKGIKMAKKILNTICPRSIVDST